jgi:hypothetical protein
VPRSKALFSVDDARLFDGASADLAGSFELRARHIPYYLTVRAGRGWFQTGLPPQKISICPKLRPLPVSLTVEMPRFLLPNRWQIAFVRIDARLLDRGVSGLEFWPAPLRQSRRVTNDTETRLSFADVAVGTFDLYLPIKPRASGSLRIEAMTGDQVIAKEEVFVVSDFLKTKIVCRTATKVAQLSASVTTPCAIDITEITFNNHNNEAIETWQEIGFPMTVGKTTLSALFILGAVPESASIYVRQEGFQPFLLSLNVEKLEEAALLDEETDPVAPLSSLIPVGYSL